MIIGTAQIYLTADWISSLKEKRSWLKSLMARTRNKFNVSIAEVGRNDVHKSAVIGIAVVSNESAHADSALENIICFIEQSTDAVVVEVVKERR